MHLSKAITPHHTKNKLLCMQTKLKQFQRPKWQGRVQTVTTESNYITERLINLIEGSVYMGGVPEATLEN